jgi:hypothetical protein
LYTMSHGDDQELKIFLYCVEYWALFNINYDNKT